MPDKIKPSLLFYCQHSLGIGHLTRSFALVQALSRDFRIIFLNGGRLPPGVKVPPFISRIDLPPIGMDDGHTLVSRDKSFDLDFARAERRRLIDLTVRNVRPEILLVELFPFGRKKFASEILPMIRATRRLSADRALVICSLRDILVDVRPDQTHHDDRARWLTDRYFNAVLVHADPEFAKLEDSFHPSKAMRTPILYSGFVVPERLGHTGTARGDHLLVSAGGGIVGDELFRAVLAARSLLKVYLPIRIVAGPFLPEAQWLSLSEMAKDLPGVTLIRHVPDMVEEMRVARASVSQCGYNTALDLVVSEVPALVVPYETRTENEQSQRAERLAALGAVLHHSAKNLRPEALAAAIEKLLSFNPQPAALSLNGAQNSTRLLTQLYKSQQPQKHLEPV